VNIQPIFNIAEILYRQGVRKAVLSPGSRNAPLIMALARHPHITCYSIPDERSAAFIALGMSRISGEPVVLACTSGSAAYNYAPAVAEAFFQQIPLILLTADRPPEWIGQLDGQTIWQYDIFGKHVKQSYALQADLSHKDAQWHVYKTTSTAVLIATAYPPGPVHINIPFREPFYPDPEEEMYYESDMPIPREMEVSTTLSDHQFLELADIWKNHPHRLIMGGQQGLDPDLQKKLSTFSNSRKIPLVGDVIANFHPLENAVQLADLYAVQEKTDIYSYLTPDILVTFGLSVVSKNVKLLFRDRPPREHWHIQPYGAVADPFQSITRIIRCTPAEFFEKMNSIELDSDFNIQKQENYKHLWFMEERKTRRILDHFFHDQPLGEFELVYETLKALPEDTVLHLANSMAVRYANWCGIAKEKSSIEVMANRGTCGIDGCNSTAAGAAMVSDKLHVLITGDVAFFYDRNAFWHNYPLNNLRILVLNNHGGGIFRMISGPGQLPELEEFFETKQPLSAKSLAEEFAMEYIFCDKKSKVSHFVHDFLQKDNRPKILEVESSSISNQEILREFKKVLYTL
jgi:2-succinyl-5-enolpyruvyl-6-hydroxy-3-cyclohexene-1-carboxylate synthase